MPEYRNRWYTTYSLSPNFHPRLSITHILDLVEAGGTDIQTLLDASANISGPLRELPPETCTRSLEDRAPLTSRDDNLKGQLGIDAHLMVRARCVKSCFGFGF